MSSWTDKSVFANYLRKADILKITTDNIERPLLISVGYLHKKSAFEYLLIQGINSLNGVSHAVKDRPDLSAMMRDLRDLLRKVCDDLGELSEDDLFRRIHPYRSLFSSFSSSLLNATNGDDMLLIVITHIFATFVALVLRFPHINYGFLINVRLQSIISINEALQCRKPVGCDLWDEQNSVDYFMQFPLFVVREYRVTFFEQEKS